MTSLTPSRLGRSNIQSRVCDLTDILDQRNETIASRNCDPGEAIGLWMFGVLAADSPSDLTWVSWTKLCERMSLERS